MPLLLPLLSVLPLGLPSGAFFVAIAPPAQPREAPSAEMLLKWDRATRPDTNSVPVARGTFDRSLETLEPLLGPEQPAARVAIEACREAWFVHRKLTEWGNEVLLVDTTRCKEIGIGNHRRKNDRIARHGGSCEEGARHRPSDVCA